MSKGTKPMELVRLSLAELDGKVTALRTQLFKLRVQHAQRQLAKPAEIRTARRELARILTIASAKRRQGDKAS